MTYRRSSLQVYLSVGTLIRIWNFGAGPSRGGAKRGWEDAAYPAS